MQEAFPKDWAQEGKEAESHDVMQGGQGTKIMKASYLLAFFFR